MATVWINGVDLEATFGIYLNDQGGILTAAAATPGAVELPYAAGEFFAGPVRVPAREFAIKAQMTAATFATNHANLRVLKDLLGEGLVTVRLAGDNDIMIEAKCVDLQAANVTPQQTQPWMDLTMVFRAPMPYWRDLQALPYRFGATATAMPQGNVGAAPEIWIYGAATNPVLTGYDSTGTTLWTATFTITLTATDALRITTSAFDMSIYKYLNTFTAVADDTLLTAGVFPKPFLASSASYRFSQWPMLSVSAGTGVALYPRMWT